MKSWQQLRGAERELELGGLAVFPTPSTCSTHLSPSTTRIVVSCWFQKGCLVILYRCYTFSVVLLIAPFFSPDLCFCALEYPRVAFLAPVASIIYSGRVVCENSCICGICLFGEGSIAYDRSFGWIPQTSELNCWTAELPDCFSLPSCAKNQYYYTVP